MKMSYFLVSLIIVMVILSEIFYVMGQSGLIFEYLKKNKLTLVQILVIKCLEEKINLWLKLHQKNRRQLSSPHLCVPDRHFWASCLICIHEYFINSNPCTMMLLIWAWTKQNHWTTSCTVDLRTWPYRRNQRQVNWWLIMGILYSGGNRGVCVNRHSVICLGLKGFSVRSFSLIICWILL